MGGRGGAQPAAGEWRGFRVEGRVQGVGFRWWTAREAGEAGIRGWVRNRSDGSVEVWAWGSPGALDGLAERLRSGPEGARVREVYRVEMDPLDMEPPGAGFEIRG
jgi:acylphosphatase